MGGVSDETFGELWRYAEVPMVGITGLRGAGKSTVAGVMVDDYKFVRAHAFDGGKAMCVTYFQRLGADRDIAARMVNGDLKDLPNPLLPDNQTPRFFMEKFGKFMGVDMGTAWTLGAEIRYACSTGGGRPVVIESLVYEANWFRSQGGFIIRVSRPGHSGPVGVESDAAQAGIVPDAEIINDGNIEDLRSKIAEVIQPIVGGR